MFIDKPFQGHQGGTQSLRGFVGDASVASRRSQGLPGISLAAGPERENHVLYSSHTIWPAKEDFAAWTKSEQFRPAHQHAGERKPLTLGYPEFEGFEVIQTIETTHPSA